MTDEEIHSALTAVLDGEGATLRQSNRIALALLPVVRWVAAGLLALPALRDVLAAAARDAEKVRRVEELRDALAETIAEAEAEAPGVRQIISPTVLLVWLNAALDPS